LLDNKFFGYYEAVASSIHETRFHGRYLPGGSNGFVGIVMRTNLWFVTKKDCR